MFRFQTGSIKRHTSEANIRRWRKGFDSKLVRLKEVKFLQSGTAVANLFRFQTGSIKSGIARQLLNTRYDVSIPNWFD